MTTVNNMPIAEYIQQLADANLQQLLTKHVEEIAAKAKEYRNTNYYSPPTTYPMQEIDYLILGADSRENIVNYIYRGMIRDPPTNDMFAVSYTFYYIDEFANLHSVIYNHIRIGINTPKRVTHNLTYAAVSVKLKSHTAIDFIKKWTMELDGEIIYNQNMYFANEAANNAYIALKDGTADGESIANLRYRKKFSASIMTQSIEEIPQLNSNVQINNIDLLYQVFCAVIKIADEVYFTTMTTRDRNTDDRRRLCFIEAAQVGLSRSRHQLSQLIEYYDQRFAIMQESTKSIITKWTATLEATTQAHRDELTAKSADLTAREAELESAQIALNESRDRFDIHVALTQRDLDKVAAEKAEQAKLTTYQSLMNQNVELDKYSEYLCSSLRDREVSTLVQEQRLLTQKVAVSVAQVALDIARDAFESQVVAKTEELKAREDTINRDSHRLYSIEYELDVQSDDIDAAKNEHMAREYLLDDREQSLADREQSLAERKRLLIERDQSLDDRDQSLVDREQLLVDREQSLTDREADVTVQENSLLERYQKLWRYESDHEQQTRWKYNFNIKSNELIKREQKVINDEQALNIREDNFYKRAGDLALFAIHLDAQDAALSEKRDALDKYSNSLYNRCCVLDDKGCQLTIYEQVYNREKAALDAREKAFSDKYEAYTDMIRKISNELSNAIDNSTDSNK